MNVQLHRLVCPAVLYYSGTSEIKDTLGPAIMSSVESVFFSEVQNELMLRERGPELSPLLAGEAVPFSEGPLFEVPLYIPQASSA